MKPGTSRTGLAIVLVAALVGLPSCALLRGNRAQCSWLELTMVPGLVVTAPRAISYGNAKCGEAGAYRLARPDYSLEFSIGTGTDSALYVRAVDSDGRRLRVQSLDFVPISPDTYNGSDNYSLRLDLLGAPSGRGRPLIFPANVEILVSGGEDTPLGRETVTVVRKTGHYFYRDF